MLIFHLGGNLLKTCSVISSQIGHEIADGHAKEGLD